MPIKVFENNVLDYVCEGSTITCDSLNIVFMTSVGREDIAQARRLLLECGGVKTFSVRFHLVKFEQRELLLEAIELIERLNVIKLSVIDWEPKNMVADSLCAYCVRAKISDLILMVQSNWLDTFIASLQRMSLRSLTIANSVMKNSMTELWDNLCPTLESLTIHDSSITGECLITKSHASLKTASVSNLPREWTAFLPLVLSHGKSLTSVDVKYLYSETILELDDEVSFVILSHPSLRDAFVKMVSERSEVEIEKAVRNKNRVHYRAMMAFLNKRVERVAAKCATGRLFRDADRLIWSFLV